MRIVIDACVLYPTIMRKMVLGAAELGAFKPLWSDRILEEWRRAAAKIEPAQEQVAGVEIALLRAAWPKANIQTPMRDDLFLPDENDTHVLATAIEAQADVIMTQNLKDFPTRILANHNIIRRDADGFLFEYATEHAESMRALGAQVQSAAEMHSGKPQNLRALLKRTKLPRLAKFLTS